MIQHKIEPAMRDRLFSAKTEIVLLALQQVKEIGNKAYLPLLFELLTANPEVEIQKEIRNLLANLKDKEAVPVLAEALQEKKYKTIRKDIATACWQNGLDYSSFMEVFIDIIIEEEFDTAFEAFTVIENFEHFPPVEVHEKLKIKMAGALRRASGQKQYLLEELLKMSSD